MYSVECALPRYSHHLNKDSRTKDYQKDNFQEIRMSILMFSNSVIFILGDLFFDHICFGDDKRFLYCFTYHLFIAILLPFCNYQSKDLEKLHWCFEFYVAIELTSQTVLGTKFDMLEKLLLSAGESLVSLQILQFMIVISLDSHTTQNSELVKLFFADF